MSSFIEEYRTQRLVYFGCCCRQIVSTVSERTGKYMAHLESLFSEQYRARNYFEDICV